MKCRACWADKAFIREVKGWRGTALSWLGVVPLKCHHCYHKFSVLWVQTIGKPLDPPALRPTGSKTDAELKPGSQVAAGTVKLTGADKRPAAAQVRRRAA